MSNINKYIFLNIKFLQPYGFHYYFFFHMESLDDETSRTVFKHMASHWNWNWKRSFWLILLFIEIWLTYLWGMTWFRLKKRLVIYYFRMFSSIYFFSILTFYLCVHLSIKICDFIITTQVSLFFFLNDQEYIYSIELQCRKGYLEAISFT